MTIYILAQTVIRNLTCETPGRRNVCKTLAFEVGIRLKSMSVVSDLWSEVNDLKPLRGPQSFFDMLYT